MAFSAIGFGCLMGLVRHLGQDMPILVISFWRFLFGVLLFVPWFLRAEKSERRTEKLGLHTLRATFLILSSVALLSAILIMPLDEVTAISFTTPLFAVIGAMIILKEKAGPRRLIALFIGFL